MFKRIDHVNIVVSDVEAAADFFKEFGFEETARGDLEGDWVSKVVGLASVTASYIALTIPGDSINLELLQYDSPESEAEKVNNSNTQGLRHLAFAVEDINLEVAKLEARGVKPFSEIQTYPVNGKKLVYFRGPDGVILELAEYAK